MAEETALYQLLNRPLETAYMEEWKQNLARGYQIEARGESFLAFQVNKHSFALPLKAIERVSLPAPYYRLPGPQHPFLLGLVPMKGRVEVAFSLLHFFNQEAPLPPQPASPARWIGLGGEEATYHFLADKVQGIVQFLPTQLQGSKKPFLSHKASHGDDSFDCLNPQSLLEALQTQHHAR